MDEMNYDTRGVMVGVLLLMCQCSTGIQDGEGAMDVNNLDEAGIMAVAQANDCSFATVVEQLGLTKCSAMEVPSCPPGEKALQFRLRERILTIFMSGDEKILRVILSPFPKGRKVPGVEPGEGEKKPK